MEACRISTNLEKSPYEVSHIRTPSISFYRLPMMSAVKRLIIDADKPILLTFDAFGTLFTPRKPVESLYTETARKHGLSGFTDQDIGTRFREGG